MGDIVKLEQGADIGGVRIPAGGQLELEANGEVRYQGRKLELAITTADVHESSELPTYIAGYTNEEFRHEEMCPIVPVDNDEDRYRTFNDANVFQPVRVKADDESDINQITVKTSLSPYKVQPRRIGAFIPKHVERQQGPNYNVREAAGARCKRVINMDLEADTNNLLFTSANWGAAQVVTLGATENWEDGADSDPIKVLRMRGNASYGPITRWWMNPEVAGIFLENEAVRAHLRHVRGDGPLDTGIARGAIRNGQRLDFSIVGVGEFSVAGAKWFNPATKALEYMMPDGVIGLASPPEVNLETMATCKRFRRKDDSGVGFNVRELQLDWRGAGGTLIVVEEASDEVMTGKVVGALILGVMA